MYTIQKKSVIIFVFIFLALVIARFAVLYPTLTTTYQDTFRIGITPINDGADWVDRAQTMLEGKKISMRPLFSVFLSLFIYLFGIDMPKLVAVIISVNVISVMLAFYTLRTYLNNVFILIFLSSLTVWRMSFLADMMTENLAFSLYIISFAFLIRGISSSEFHYLLSGTMLTGLVQAIRPWDVFTLGALAVYPIAYMGFKKKAYKMAGILLLAGAFGFSFNIIDSKIFSNGEQDKIDRANYFYGQMCGGKGCNYWILDPEIKAATIKYDRGIVPASDVEKLIYKKAFAAFKNKPINFLKGTFEGLRFFLAKVYMVFNDKKIAPLYFVSFFLLLLFLLIQKPIPYIRDAFSKAPIAKMIVLILSVILLTGKSVYLFSVFAVIGILFSFKGKDRRHIIFLVLYLIGILFTLLTIGPVGGDRMWMSPEIIAYYLSSWGLAYFFFNQKKPFNEEEKEIHIDAPKCARYAMFLGMLFISFFIVLPLAARATYANKEKAITSEVNPSVIAKDLGIKSRIITKETIIDNILLWPLPTFEKLNGEWAYWRATYRPFKAFYMDANEGLYDKKWRFSKWHLLAMPFPRVGFDDRNPILFPYTTKEKLARFENMDIVILGKLIGRARLTFTHQGFMILAEYIGYPDENGQLKWVALKDL